MCKHPRFYQPELRNQNAQAREKDFMIDYQIVTAQPEPTKKHIVAPTPT